MPEKFGIENLQKVLNFGVTLGTHVAGDLKDNKLTFLEVLQLASELSIITEFVANKDAIIAEAKDLSIDEIKQLVEGVKGAIKDEKVVAVIEHALGVIISISSLIQDFKKAPAPAPVP